MVKCRAYTERVDEWMLATLSAASNRRSICLPNAALYNNNVMHV